MAEIIGEYKKNGLLGEVDGVLVLLKRIAPEDCPVFENLKNIEHPNLARVYGVQSIGETVYSVCEFVQGITLTEYIRLNGTLTDEETVRFSVQLCDGLSVLHRQRLIHRDIKPDNIIITRNKNAVLIDYGITRIYREGVRQDTQILGTVGFAAPEQFGFLQSGERSDIYSLGVTLNYMKTGKMLNEAKAPQPLYGVIEKCTSMDAENRYENCEALAIALTGEQPNRKTLSILKYLPGFRSGHIGGAIGYTAATAFSVFMLGVLATMPRKDAVHLWLDRLSAVGFFAFFVPVPLFIATNTFCWVERLKLDKRYTKKEIQMFKILFCFVSVLLSIVFIIIDT